MLVRRRLQGEARRHENAKNQIETAREQALMRENKKYEDNMRKLNAPRDKASDERTSALSALHKSRDVLASKEHAIKKNASLARKVAMVETDPQLATQLWEEVQKEGRRAFAIARRASERLPPHRAPNSLEGAASIA